MLNTQETVIDTSSNSSKRSGFHLKINQVAPEFDDQTPIIVDVETDERDNWVGMALCQLTSNTVYYYSDFELAKRMDMTGAKLIAHNAKFDIRVLKKWGFNVGSKNIFLDTMLMSYVYDTTAETHRLKEIAKKYLNLQWSTYDQMIGKETDQFKEQKQEYIQFFAQQIKDPKWKGTAHQIKKYMREVEGVDVKTIEDVRTVAETVPIARKLLFLQSKRCTLNYHPVQDVAEYCGSDVYATMRLANWFLQRMTPAQRRILYTLEMPLYRILFDMEEVGIHIDEEQLDKNITQFQDKIRVFKDQMIHECEDPTLDFDSNKQIAKYLCKKGFRLPKTSKGNWSVKSSVLTPLMGKSLFVNSLMGYRKATKMLNTFLLGMKKQNTLPKIHATFNQVVYDEDKDNYGGISTNRLSCSNPNLQSIPRRGEGSSVMRSLFIPDPGHTMIVGDYSQIEYRLLAHFTKEPMLLEAYKNGKDMHGAVGEMFGRDRELGKSLNFAAIYGAGPDKVSSMVGCSEEDARHFLDQYWRRLPKASIWRNQIIEKAKFYKGIVTYMGRFIPLPGLGSRDLHVRSHAERCAVNYVIQGSAAEVIKLAMIKVVKAGYLPRVQIHDELIFSLKDPIHLNVIKLIMESVVKLDVPLVVDIHPGVNWNEAKG